MPFQIVVAPPAFTAKKFELSMNEFMCAFMAQRSQMGLRRREL